MAAPGTEYGCAVALYKIPLQRLSTGRACLGPTSQPLHGRQADSLHPDEVVQVVEATPSTLGHDSLCENRPDSGEPRQIQYTCAVHIDQPLRPTNGFTSDAPESPARVGSAAARASARRGWLGEIQCGSEPLHRPRAQPPDHLEVPGRPENDATLPGLHDRTGRCRSHAGQAIQFDSIGPVRIDPFSLGQWQPRPVGLRDRSRCVGREPGQDVFRSTSSAPVGDRETPPDSAQQEQHDGGEAYRADLTCIHAR